MYNYSMRKYFHFYHSRLTAELLFFLPLFFLLILVAGIFTPKTDFEKNKDSQNHEALAKSLISSNQFEEAKHELPSDSPDLQIIKNLEGQPEEIKKQIIFWQQVSQDYPNYRDAYIKLAILNWNIYRLFDAQKFLSKALEIDPNNETASKLVNMLR